MAFSLPRNAGDADAAGQIGMLAVEVVQKISALINKEKDA
jgi:hypothetical protein